MAGPPATGADALDRLLEGNARFVAGAPRGTPPDDARRAALAAGQSPFAVVLSCSDSRVAAEMVFDLELGDVFSVRVAGNTAAHPVLVGSIEFGVAVLGAPLVMVLGHRGCGAILAALEYLGGGALAPGEIPSVVEAVLPAVRETPAEPSGDRGDRAVRENVRRQVAALERSSAVLGDAVAAGRLLVVGAEYDMVTGRVEVVGAGGAGQVAGVAR